MIITLIGFSGSGKSTVGKKLSKKIAYPHIDLDKYVEQQTSHTIDQLFTQFSEEYFRQIEQRCLEQVLHSKEDLILSLGGGTPCYKNNLERINTFSTSIYLKLEEQSIFNRLSQANNGHRPLIMNKNKSDLKQYISKTLEYRERYYSQAKHTVSAININAKKIAEIISLCYNP